MWPVTRWLLLVLVGVLVLGAALLLSPRSPRLTDATTGDADLLARVRAVLGDDAGYQTLHVAEITKDSVRYAGLGSVDDRTPDETTPFELGSITKTFDGLLLADAVTRSEVRATDQLGEHLTQLAGTPMGEVSLEELSQHRAGVPPLPPSILARVPLSMIANTNPYSLDTASLLREVATLQLMKTRGTFLYSNLGATLLGHALAAAAGEPDWRRYVASRLLEPLGMSHTTFAATRADVPATTLVGLSDNGRRMVPWTTEAFAPAGAATWTTAADMTRYVQAILTGTAPGLDALTPRWDLGQGGASGLDRIGYGWFTTTVDGHQTVWHDGGTSGYRTMLVIDRDQGRAVLAVSSTTRAADALPRELLKTEPQKLGGAQVPWAGLVLLALAVLVVGWSALAAARGSDGLGLVTRAFELVGVLTLVRALGPWSVLPGWTWAILVAAAAVTLVVGALRIRRSVVSKRPWLRWLTAGLTIVVAMLFAALTIP